MLPLQIPDFSLFHKALLRILVYLIDIISLVLNILYMGGFTIITLTSTTLCVLFYAKDLTYSRVQLS